MNPRRDSLKKKGIGAPALRQKPLKISLQHSTDGTGAGFLKMEALVLHVLHGACLPLVFLLLHLTFVFLSELPLLILSTLY